MTVTQEGTAGHDGRVLGRVCGTRSLGDMAWITLRTPAIRTATVGQFAMLQREPSARFLPRAYSIAGQEDDQLSFLVAPVGPGSRELASVVPGDRVQVLAPLGRGLDLVFPGTRMVLVGGGTGVAPLCLALARLAEGRAEAPEILVLAGFRNDVQAAAAVPLNEGVERLRLLAYRGDTVPRLEVVTEDGSVGSRGLVSDLVAQELRPGDRVLVCGPSAMCEAVWRVVSGVQEVRSWFSLESAMACGVGSCHGCAQAMPGGRLVRVCREGPVFSGEEAFGGI